MMMNVTKYLIQLLSLWFLSLNVSIAQNPIEWSVLNSLPATAMINSGTYDTTYIFENKMPTDMVKPLFILKSASPAASYTFDDRCSGRTLSKNGRCRVIISFTPTSMGTNTVQLTQDYGHTRVPLPTLNTQVESTDTSSAIQASVVTALPATLTVGQSAPWEIQFTNNGTMPLTGVDVVVSGSAAINNCPLILSNVAPHNTCTAQGRVVGSVVGTDTVQATLYYSQGASVSASTSTIVTATDDSLVCTASVPLPPEVLRTSDNQATLLCTNKGAHSIVITGHTTTLPQDQSGGAVVWGTFTPDFGGDNCTAGTLAPGAACQLKGTYTAPAVIKDDVVIALSVDYFITLGQPKNASTSTSTNVVATIANYRKISLINRCDFDVWWSASGGAVAGSSCTSDAECNNGSKCYGGYCYFNNYGPTLGSYHLPSGGGTATTHIFLSDASSGSTLWSGVISASTGCDGTTTCANNGCGNNGGSTSCAVGTGFQQPATEAEFTFELLGLGNKDTYDITFVNGFSIPMSMQPSEAPAQYDCGRPGSNEGIGITGLPACDFSNVTPPTNMYYWVTNTGNACTRNNRCSNPNKICGLAFDNNTNGFVKNCGSFLGYWSANQICQTKPNFISPFGDGFRCNTFLNGPFPGKTYHLTQLLKCSPPNSALPLFNSCYLTYPPRSNTTNCCGCSDWTGITVPAENCPAGQTNSEWTLNVLPLIRWMKEACPTGYVYPFDDKASTFQCTASPATEYTITFCPGGGTGLPSGTADGR